MRQQPYFGNDNENNEPTDVVDDDAAATAERRDAARDLHNLLTQIGTGDTLQFARGIDNTINMLRTFRDTIATLGEMVALERARQFERTHMLGEPLAHTDSLGESPPMAAPAAAPAAPQRPGK